MKILFGLLCGACLLICGCRSASTLDRKKSPRRQSIHPGTVRQTPRTVKRNESNDPACDMMFRKKQKHDGASVLSEEEKMMMQQGAGEDASALHHVRGRERIRDNNRQKDWVFGTKEGKYF